MEMEKEKKMEIGKNSELASLLQKRKSLENEKLALLKKQREIEMELGKVSDEILKTCDQRINLAGDRVRYKSNDDWSPWYSYKTENSVKVSKISQVQFWSHILKMTPENNYIDYSSINSRLISRRQIYKYPLNFYKQLYHKYIDSNLACFQYLDRAWDTLFKK